MTDRPMLFPAPMIRAFRAERRNIDAMEAT